MAVFFLVAPAHRVRGYYYWESSESQMGSDPTLPKKPKIRKAGTFSTLQLPHLQQAQLSHCFTPKQRSFPLPGVR